MKKLATIFLTSLVLLSSMGVTVAYHYCGRSLQDVAIYGNAKSCCEGDEMPVGCCHNEKIEVKSDNYQVAQQIHPAGFFPVLIREGSFAELDFSVHFKQSKANFLTQLDPGRPPASADILILVQSFLI
jgi:hypothetical protein